MAIARYKIGLIVQFLWKLKQAKISTNFFKEKKKRTTKGTVLFINKGPRCTVLTFITQIEGKSTLKKAKNGPKLSFLSPFLPAVKPTGHRTVRVVVVVVVVVGLL